MLSQEIYDSWNAKTTGDLKELLDSIEGPKIPDNVPITKFKKSVLNKLGRRRASEAQSQTSLLNHENSTRCCWCKKSRKIKYHECKSLPYFDKLCVAATETFTRSISTVKALIQKLSYWESIKKGMDGLSVIGGDLWILSFACQHLIDCPGYRDKFCMKAHMVGIKETYQELAQAGELFLDAAQAFHSNTHTMRSEALLVLKKLAKKWSIKDQNNPLRVRPETMKQFPRPRKRLGSGLDASFDKKDDDDDIFSVKWSPLLVTIQLSSSERPKPFGQLHPQDRVTVFTKFLRSTLDKVEMTAEDLASLSRQLIQVDIENTDTRLSAMQITQSIQGFSKGKYAPKVLADNERERMVLLLNEFWYSVDVFHENVYILLRLVQETRDIIRTCYVYTDIFYKWHMPSYDHFISKAKRSARAAGNKDILQKITPSAKKLSETASILSLMDFSSSIYQGVVQEIPSQCEGMLLRLCLSEVDHEKDEPYGLVRGTIDKRKSGIDGKKSINSTKIRQSLLK